ncbi:MAG TPA: hypothetical protein VKP30_09870 [Polyangiaceae bacterium]|nr:hypothetical protein [Polyangiaceae bacterium]
MIRTMVTWLGQLRRTALAVTVLLATLAPNAARAASGDAGEEGVEAGGEAHRSTPDVPPSSAAAAPAPNSAAAASPQAAPKAPPTAPRTDAALSVHATWNDRLVLESEDKRFRLQPIGILQSLFTLPINAAGERFYEGTGFTLRRAAFGFDACLFGSVRTFFLANIASGSLTLWDFFTDLDFFDGHAVLRVGRFRPWLGRQRLLAGDRYQMTQLPAALTDLLEIGDGRDLGAGVFGLLASRTLEYNVGVWNGEQRYSVDSVNGFLPSSNLRNRGNTDFEFGARLVYHPFGFLPAIDESDLEISRTPKLSTGVAALLAKRHDVRAPTASFVYVDDRVLKAGAELAFRWQGFSLEAEAFVRKGWLLPEAKPEIKKQYDELGLGAIGKSAYVQSGYFITKRLELTGRFDYVDIEPTKPGHILRPAGGLNLFVHRYNFLVQLMYRANIGRNFANDIDFWRSLRPNDRTDIYVGDRPISRTTHDVYLMLQTSL